MDFSKEIDALQDELIADVQKIVKIKSVLGASSPEAPFGNGVRDALVCILEIAEKLGFRTVNMNGYMGYAEYGNAADNDYIGVLGHVDVVPEGDGWQYPPYGAEIHEGKLYGRGVLDDKGPLIAALYGLKAVAMSGLPLKRKVRIMFGTNEENGSNELSHYFETEKPPLMGFTPDAEFPIIHAEKGAMMMWVRKHLVQEASEASIVTIHGGTRPNIVPKICKTTIQSSPKVLTEIMSEIEAKGTFMSHLETVQDQIVLTATGKESHGSLPELGINSIQWMLKDLSTIKLPQKVSEEITFLHNLLGMDYEGIALGIAKEDTKEDTKAHAIEHTILPYRENGLTVNVGMLEVTDQDITLALDIRYPAVYSGDELSELLAKRFGVGGYITEVAMQLPALYFSPNHPLIASLSKVYTEQTGQPATLKTIGGSTYAKSMDNIVAFGALFPESQDVSHGPDENMSIEHLLKCAKIYGAAIFELGLQDEHLLKMSAD